MAAISNAIKKLLNSEQIKYAESVIKDYNQILKNKHNPNMSGYERRQNLQQFYKQYSPENLEVTNYEQRISELNEIREHYSEPDFQFTNKTNSLYRAFPIPNSEYKMVLPNPNTTLENQAYEMAGAKELFGDEIKYRDNFHVSSPAFIKNEDDGIKIIKRGSIHNDSRDKYLVKLDNNDIDSSNNFSTTVKKQNVTSSSIENNSNSKVNSVSKESTLDTNKEEINIPQEKSSQNSDNIADNTTTQNNNYNVEENTTNSQSIPTNSKTISGGEKNKTISGSSPTQTINGGEQVKSNDNINNILDFDSLENFDLSALDKASKNKGLAYDYLLNRTTNEYNSTIARMKEASNNVDGTSLKKLTNKYGNTNEKIQQYFIDKINQGPTITDYAMGYKAPQAITGVTLLGGMASMALGNNKGQKTNAELYSNPF